jgi:hypothetical protein
MILQSMGGVIDPRLQRTAMDKVPRNTFMGSRADSLYTNQPKAVRCSPSHIGRDPVHSLPTTLTCRDQLKMSKDFLLMMLG